MKNTNEKIDALRYAIAGLSADELKQLKGMDTDDLHKFFTAKERNNELRHLDNPLYQRTREDFIDTQYQQIIKGSKTYDEPLKAKDWTMEQLYNHALQESVDGLHYKRAMLEKYREMELEIEHLEACKKLYVEMMNEVGKLTKFLVMEFPEVGNAGEYSTKVAIDLLKGFKQNVDKNHNHTYDMLNKLRATTEQCFPLYVQPGIHTAEIAAKLITQYRSELDNQ